MEHLNLEYVHSDRMVGVHSVAYLLTMVEDCTHLASPVPHVIGHSYTQVGIVMIWYFHTPSLHNINHQSRSIVLAWFDVERMLHRVYGSQHRPRLHVHLHVIDSFV